MYDPKRSFAAGIVFARGQFGLTKNGAVQLHLGEGGAGEIGAAEIGAPEIRGPEPRVNENRLAKIGIGEVDSW